MFDSIDVELISRELGAHETPLLALALFEGDDAPDLEGFDPAFRGLLDRALEEGDFRGRSDDRLLLYSRGRIGRLLVLGAGKREAYGAETARRLAARAVRAAEQLSLERITILLDPGGPGAGGRDAGEGAKGQRAKKKARGAGGGAGEGAAAAREGEALPLDPQRLAQAATEGAALAAWDFRELKQAPADDGSDGERRTGSVRTVELSGEGKEPPLREGIRIGLAIARGQNLARTLQARPGNVATPTHLGEVARESAKRFGFEATILGPQELRDERMHALLAVAQGSEQEPRLIVLRHNGAKASEPALILVGKGLTFDSGGISLKPPQGMGDMKFDMSGGAAVIGALQAVAELGLPLNVVGIVPSSENLVSGRAMKPGDVIRTRAGKTVEVGNTDAEGRLILADALSYAGEFSPAAIVDCATLTGACVVALGHHAAAVLGNDDALVQELRDAGEAAGERCWPLPLWDEYRKQIDSDVADIANMGGRPAGTITAAHFLKEFAGGMTWAHLDIAGTAYGEDPLPYQRKGGYGFPTRLLVEWVRSRTR